MPQTHQCRIIFLSWKSEPFLHTCLVELERYQELNSLIEARLIVLDPLIDKLEQVAAAVGDVSQVAAAQRTVALIRVIKQTSKKNLNKHKLNFIATALIQVN